MKKKALFHAWLIGLSFFSFNFLQSCKKQDDIDTANQSGSSQGTNGATYYIRFKVDGVQKQFVKDAAAALTNPKDSLYSFQAVANLNGNAQKSNSTSILFFDKIPISTNITYTDYSTKLPASRQVADLYIQYTDETGNVYISFPEQYAGAFQITPDAKVIITEITATQVKANFSSTVYYGPSGSAKLTAKHVISEGQLVVQKL